MPARKEVSAIKGAIVTLGSEVKQGRCKTERVAALASLISALARLLRIYDSRRKSGGDPLYKDLMNE